MVCGVNGVNIVTVENLAVEVCKRSSVNVTILRQLTVERHVLVLQKSGKSVIYTNVQLMVFSHNGQNTVHAQRPVVQVFKGVREVVPPPPPPMVVKIVRVKMLKQDHVKLRNVQSTEGSHNGVVSRNVHRHAV